LVDPFFGNWVKTGWVVPGNLGFFVGPLKIPGLWKRVIGPGEKAVKGGFFNNFFHTREVNTRC